MIAIMEIKINKATIDGVKISSIVALFIHNVKKAWFRYNGEAMLPSIFCK